MDSDLIYWLWLTIAFGPANPSKWNKLSHYGSVKEAYEDISRGNMNSVMPQDLRSVKSARIEQAVKLIEYCRNKHINIYCFGDDKFPKKLKEIYNPPSVLFAVGNIGIINESVVLTCVGSRNPSEYYVGVTRRISAELADSGIVIASGNAVGLDTVSLESAVKAGGKVCSVIPCGLLYDYPKDSAAIKRTVARNGVVISEFFPDNQPSSLSFQARNRILSGISMGTLITQAGESSGTLSTASFALEQNRDIFCIPPHDIFNNEYSGVASLIRDGAISVFDSSDVLREYYTVYSDKLNRNSAVLRQKVFESVLSEEKNEPPEKSKPPKHDGDEKPIMAEVKNINTDGMSDEKKKIIEFISGNGTVHFDDIASLSDWTEDIETLLTELELGGFIKSVSGNRYTI